MPASPRGKPRGGNHQLAPCSEPGIEATYAPFRCAIIWRHIRLYRARRTFIPPFLKRRRPTIAQGKFSAPRQKNRPSGDDCSNTPQDLEQFIDSIHTLCADPPPEQPAPPAVRRRKPIWPVILVLILVLAAGSYLFLSPGKKIPQGVSVSGLSLDGLSKKAATQAVEAAFSPKRHDIVLSVRTFP